MKYNSEYVTAAEALSELISTARHLDASGQHVAADLVAAQLELIASRISDVKSPTTQTIELSPEQWLEDHQLTFDQFLEQCKSWALNHGSVAGMTDVFREQRIPKGLTMRVFDIIDPKDFFQGI